MLQLLQRSLERARARHDLQDGHRKDRGFTLIELLIVIIILGILAAIVVFAVGGITDHGQNAACQADYTTVETAEEAYFAKNTAYTADVGELVTAGYLHSDPGTVTVTLGGSSGYTVAGTTGSKCDGITPN